jgi:uncharacterized phiE125 gp8 family phage protein
VATIITLADAKTFLRVYSTDTDAEITDMLEAVSDVCERFTRKVWRSTTYTETYTVDAETTVLHLRHAPVTSITTVTENGTAVSASGYTLDGRQGWLQRGSSLSPMCWQQGFQNVAVVYVCGPPGSVPSNIEQGCRLLAQHMWETQRGGGLPRQAGADGEIDPRLGFYVPNRVRQAWGEPRILVR